MKKFYLLTIALFMNLAIFAQCSNIFFSEYIEGSSNNKAVEIYNPTSNTIDLSNYKFYRFNNGSSTPSDSFTTSASLAPDNVYVIANPSSNSAILAQADTTHTFTFYNGDDALCIVEISTGDTLDIFGVIGIDPGSSWSVGSGATANNTLVRKSTIKAGQKDWSTGSMEWDVYAIDADTYLGSHTSDCHVPSSPVVSFKSATMKVNEGDGVIEVAVSITAQSSSLATSVTLSVTGGTAVSGTDYSSSLPSTLTFPAGSSTDQKVQISLTDNFTTNDDLTIEFSLSAVSGHASLGNDSVLTLTIADDDYEVADIKDLWQYDADLSASNKGKRYEITGTVYGVDFDGNAGLSFTLIDGTDGINIFNFVDVSDYVVTEGDNITARGKIDFYRGLLELLVDSIKVNSQGNALKEPTLVEVVSEATESEYIRLRKVWVADTSTVWRGNNNILLTNDNKDTFQIRIDRDATDIADTPIPYDTMTIVGIGGQFDATAPYDEGYQIFAYKASDVMEYVAPNKVTFKVDMSRYMNDGGTFNTVNLNGTFNDWCGTCIEMVDADNDKVYEVTVELPDGAIEWKYTLNGWDMQEEFEGGEPCTVTNGGFTNRSTTISGNTDIPVVCYNKCITCAEAIATIDETTIDAISVYPNPSNSILTIKSTENWLNYEVYNVLGLKVKAGALNNNSLSVADMATGTYYIKLTSDNKMGEARFVVNR